MADPPRKMQTTNRWYQVPLPSGATAIMSKDNARTDRAERYFSGGGNSESGMKGLMSDRDFKWHTPGLAPGEYYQNREELGTGEFDLQSAMRDRLLRGQ